MHIWKYLWRLFVSLRANVWGSQWPRILYLSYLSDRKWNTAMPKDQAPKMFCCFIQGNKKMTNFCAFFEISCCTFHLFLIYKYRCAPSSPMGSFFKFIVCSYVMSSSFLALNNNNMPGLPKSLFKPELFF